MHELIQCLDNQYKWSSRCLILLAKCRHSAAAHVLPGVHAARSEAKLWDHTGLQVAQRWLAVTLRVQDWGILHANVVQRTSLYCMCACVCASVSTVRGCMCYRESFNPIWRATYCDRGCPRPLVWFCERKDNYFTFRLKFIIRGRERQVNDR